MPNVDQLILKGVTFMDAHSTPLCTPSRYILLSGNYLHWSIWPQTVWNLNNGNANLIKPYQKRIAEVLWHDSYAMGMFGKWYLGGGVARIDGSGFNKTNLLTNPKNDWSNGLVKGPKDIYRIWYVTDYCWQGSACSFCIPKQWIPWDWSIGCCVCGGGKVVIPCHMELPLFTIGTKERDQKTGGIRLPTIWFLLMKHHNLLKIICKITTTLHFCIRTSWSCPRTTFIAW